MRSPCTERRARRWPRSPAAAAASTPRVALAALASPHRPYRADASTPRARRTRYAGPALQRALTLSEWDHVALVVHMDAAGHVCEAARSARCGLVHADSGGCSLYRADAFVQQREQYDEVALRGVVGREAGRIRHVTAT